MHRRRLGLTQDHIAALLGCRHRAKVCRYERRTRRPGLKAVFAYEVIYGVPASELFAGLRDRAERDVRRRAKRLLARITKAEERRNVKEVAAVLSSLAYADDGELRYKPISRR